jgi:hypothetical protein
MRGTLAHQHAPHDGHAQTQQLFHKVNFEIGGGPTKVRNRREVVNILSVGIGAVGARRGTSRVTDRACI